MAAGVLCVGRNSVDYVFNVDLDRVRPDRKQPTGDPAISIGGQCVNAAVTLAGLGCAVAYAGVIGDDVSGELVMAFLAERGVDCRAVERAPHMANACAYILVDGATGERSIIETAADAYPAYNGKVPDAVWTGTTHVYFDGHEVEASLAIAREATRRAIPTLTDVEVVTEKSRALIGCVDTSIVPKAVAAEIAGTDAPAGMLAALATLGGRRHIITLGGEGAIGAVAGQAMVSVAAEPCEVVDTTGAGDAFHAGFLFADIAGASFTEALAFAARVAAVACATPGPNAGSAKLSRLAAMFNRET